MVVSIVAVQVRLTGVPAYSVVVLEGLVMVRVSWGGGTDTKQHNACNQSETMEQSYFVFVENHC